MKIHDRVGRLTSAARPLDFDPDLYLALNPDVATRIAEGAVAGALEHWLAEGRADEEAGRRPSIDEPDHYVPGRQACRPPSEAEIAAFDPDLYLDHNPDVARSGHSRESAFEHWVSHGRHEGRPCFSPSRLGRRLVDLEAMLERPFGINFYAPFSARSGLGSAARGYLKAIRAAGIPVRLYNLNYDLGPIRVTVRDYDTAPTYSVNLLQVNADTVERVLRLFRMEQFDDAYTIGIWAWEMNVLRPDWYGSFAAVDEVWSLSDFNTASIAAVSPVPVTTMNPVVTAPSAVPGFDRAYFGLPDGVLFLTVFDVGSSIDRKNPYAAIDAFQEAFAGRTGVHLVVKFHSGHEDAAATRGLMRYLRGRDNVIVRADKLSREEMDGLLRCADCLLSPHRSEGFGLNVAEFMALGRPVIATGYGGTMDFTTEENSYLLSYVVRPMERRSGPYLPGYLWAEPDRADLVRHMRRVVDRPEEAAAKGAAGAARVAATLSPEAVGARILARFDELGLRGSVPPFVRLLGASRGLTLPAAAAVAPLDDAWATEEPTISVVVPVYDVAPEWLLRCIESVRAQTYPRWELCLCDDASTRGDTVAALRRYQGLDPRIRIMRLPENGGIAAASNAAALLATGRFLLMLDNDDELTSDALRHVAAAISADPEVDVLYADEDKLDEAGRLCDHYHKPDWSPEHLESVMYTLHPLVVRTALFLDLGGFRAAYSGAQDYDLMLRLSRRTDAIRHVPHILYHWRKIPGSASAAVDAKPAALDAGRRALADHVAEAYGPGRASVEPGLLPGLHRVRHHIAPDVEVSILILTNNATIALPDRGRFTMVDNLVESIVRHTTYPRHRIVVVDDGNSSRRQARRYATLGVRLVSFARSTPFFNFSDKANFALRHAETEHVVFMNDDMEVRNGDWLSALVEFSQRPEIGACAGKLLHADGTIQHAGVVLGIDGGAAHVYHNAPGDLVGYNGYTHLIRNYSALTAACLATRRRVMAEVGGFDPKLAIDFNDIDLCLRMRRSQYRLVYTPHSEVVHFESASARRTAQNPSEVALFRSRWREVVERDPHYNPNLSLTRLDFAPR